MLSKRKCKLYYCMKQVWRHVLLTWDFTNKTIKLGHTYLACKISVYLNFPRSRRILGSLSNNDGDGHKNVT